MVSVSVSSFETKASKSQSHILRPKEQSLSLSVKTRVKLKFINMFFRRANSGGSWEASSQKLSELAEKIG